MAAIDDNDLAAYVEIQNCCVLDQEGFVLSKAQELLRSEKSAPHAHGVIPADDSKKISQDAVGVLQAFENIGSELNFTNDTNLRKQWDDNYATYRNLLGDTVRLAEQGSKYIQSFYDTVVARFSRDDVDWEKDKNLIADFIKENGGQQIVDQTAQASQKFKELKYNTQSFHEQYADNAAKKGQVYDAKLKAMNDDRRKVQARIDSNRASAAQLRSSMRRTAGPGFLLGRIVAGILALLGIGTFNRANDRVGALEREEQQLLNERAEIDRKADTVAKEGSTLVQTQYALSVLTDNVSDISGRLDTLAQVWSEAHANFVALGELLKLASESSSRAAFMGRLNLIAESTSTLTANMRAYMDGVAPGGVLVKPLQYIKTGVFGNASGGAFDDAKSDLHPTMSIVSISLVIGSPGIEGLHVTYRLKDGGSRTENHGTNRSGATQVNLGPTEYISAMAVWLMQWGNTSRVSHLRFEITNSTSGAKRVDGPHGGGQAVRYTVPSWTGRLLCFAGSANNGAGQAGLQGIKFIQLKPGN